MNPAVLPGKSFGQSVRRVEDERFLTGRGRYVDDINLPRQLYAAFVRSPEAHAKISSVRINAALAAPGVVAVLTGEDFAASGLGPLICGWGTVSRDGSPVRVGHRPALARGCVRYVGEPVALVLGESRDLARDGADLVEVAYEPLPVNVDSRRAQVDGMAQLHPEAPGNRAFDWEIGDKAATDAAMARAAKVVRLNLRNNRLVPNYMEPRALLAAYDSAEQQHTLYLTTQNPHGVRALLSAVIGFGPAHKVRVISPDVGGGFGGKAPMYNEEVACLWAAKMLHRPVKWTCDRSEAFLADAHGRDHWTEVSLALDAEGRFLALDVHTIANLGGYISLSGTLVPTLMYATLLSGQYAIPAIYARVEGVYTNTAPTDAYRGAGRPEACYVIERIVERAAVEIGVDPAELRRRNFVRAFPYKTALMLEYDIGDYESQLTKALAAIRYDAFPARRTEAAARGKLRGIGVSTYIEAAGFGPSAIFAHMGGAGGTWESAMVRFTSTGAVEVMTGTHAHGQGHETVFAQLVADRLGVPFENVRIIHGDTESVQHGAGTVGSRSGPLGLSAIAQACDKVVAKMKRIAAHLLDVPIETITFEEGVFAAQNTNKSILVPDIVGAAFSGAQLPVGEIEPGLLESAHFDPPNFTFPTGAYICEVEVDPETGMTTIVDFVAVDDFGTIGNPMIVEGQVHGGLAQGIGQALLEDCVYDPESGQMLTGSFMDYCMPRADDLPDFRVDFTVTPSPSNPLGMKGCGEAGAVGAPPALINALCDALGVADIDMPATPEKIWRLAQARRRGEAA